MSVPPSTHRAWMDIVTGKEKHDFDFLAAKMVVGRVQMTVMQDPSVGTIQRCANEVREVFAKNSNLTKVKTDLAKIFGEGA